MFLWPQRLPRPAEGEEKAAKRRGKWKGTTMEGSGYVCVTGMTDLTFTLEWEAGCEMMRKCPCGTAIPIFSTSMFFPSLISELNGDCLQSATPKMSVFESTAFFVLVVPHYFGAGGVRGGRLVFQFPI